MAALQGVNIVVVSAVQGRGPDATFCSAFRRVCFQVPSCVPGFLCFLSFRACPLAMSDSAEITHGESLWETLDVLRDSGQHGAKVCLGMANFLSERAAIETSYGNVRRTAAVIHNVSYIELRRLA